MKREAAIVSATGFRYHVKVDDYGNLILYKGDGASGVTFSLDSHVSPSDLFNAIRYVKGLKTK